MFALLAARLAPLAAGARAFAASPAAREAVQIGGRMLMSNPKAGQGASRPTQQAPIESSSSPSGTGTGDFRGV